MNSSIKATILKVSESKKSLFVSLKTNPFDRGTVGYLNNPQDREYAKGDIIVLPQAPIGLKPMIDQDGTVRTTKTGDVLLEFYFMRGDDMALPIRKVAVEDNEEEVGEPVLAKTN